MRATFSMIFKKINSSLLLVEKNFKSERYIISEKSIRLQQQGTGTKSSETKKHFILEIPQSKFTITLKKDVKDLNCYFIPKVLFQQNIREIKSKNYGIY